jgi:hypothetical protein
VVLANQNGQLFERDQLNPLYPGKRGHAAAMATNSVPSPPLSSPAFTNCI